MIPENQFWRYFKPDFGNQLKKNRLRRFRARRCTWFSKISKQVLLRRLVTYIVVQISARSQTSVKILNTQNLLECGVVRPVPLASENSVCRAKPTKPSFWASNIGSSLPLPKSLSGLVQNSIKVDFENTLHMYVSTSELLQLKHPLGNVSSIGKWKPGQRFLSSSSLLEIVTKFSFGSRSRTSHHQTYDFEVQMTFLIWWSLLALEATP